MPTDPFDRQIVLFKYWDENKPKHYKPLGYLGGGIGNSEAIMIAVLVSPREYSAHHTKHGKED